MGARSRAIRAGTAKKALHGPYPSGALEQVQKSRKRRFETCPPGRAGARPLLSPSSRIARECHQHNAGGARHVPLPRDPAPALRSEGSVLMHLNWPLPEPARLFRNQPDLCLDTVWWRLDGEVKCFHTLAEFECATDQRFNVDST